ncbi:hypothetical protein [Vibrio gazogenes]|uniref:Uncharacterized protein n=1 Tax=Vibrio gazogenes TaxID=687 RepID=A0A1Z2SEN0_VIBGA|nr:hypothetical protein [Vibrio gazogenes]ASA55634.1 hypothetical protein BSQ33_07940 [Vibrio gazogenes]
MSLGRWVRRFCLIVLVLLILKVSFDIWVTPDYKGQDAYVSNSPDGQYKALIVPTTSRTVLILQHLKDQNNLIVTPLPKDWVASLSDDNWTCDKENGCTAYRAGYQPEFSLPPSFWLRLHTWLTIKIKHLENPQLKEINRDE